MKKFLKLIVIICIWLSIYSLSHASTITFNGLTGSTGELFNGYTEGGFTVIPFAAEFFKDFNIGNPVPDIVTGTVGTFVLKVTLTTPGQFTFSGVDLRSNSHSGSGFTFQGYLGSTQVVNYSALLNSANTFVNEMNPSPGILLDTLYILMQPYNNSSTSVNIDNIGVNPASAVPEPTTILLFGSGVLGLWRLKKKFMK